MSSFITALTRWRDKKILEYGSLAQWELTRSKGLLRYVGRLAAIQTGFCLVIISALRLWQGKPALDWFDLVSYAVLGYVSGYFVWRRNEVRYRKELAQARLKGAEPYWLG